MKTYWLCRKCNAKHDNPFAVCSMVEGTKCNAKESNKGFMGYIWGE